MVTQPAPVLPVSAQVPHISRILVPVDFSDASFAAVRRALDVASVYNASILLAHVMTHRPAHTPNRLNPEDAPALDLEIQQKLELLRHLALDRDIPCSSIFRTGPIAENIHNIIARENIDLVVLATHGGRNKFGIFLGSTAEQLIRSIQVPVLTIGDAHQPLNWTDKGPRHILFAANFATSTLEGLSFALGVRQTTGAQVSVAEVVPVGVWPDILTLIRQRIASIVPPGTEVHLPTGRVGEKICELAGQIGAGLIVLGVHRDSFLREVFGSNLLHIILNAPCPVLTMRRSVNG